VRRTTKSLRICGPRIGCGEALKQTTARVEVRELGAVGRRPQTVIDRIDPKSADGREVVAA
jgi:hypothetical protein